MKDPYRRLQQHLNTLPVGFPSTLTGVEIRILKYLFTPIEAEIATFLTINFAFLSELYLKMSHLADSQEHLAGMLDNLSKKGLIIEKIEDGVVKYANAPFVIGIFEFNIENLNHEFFKDIESYMKQGFAIEMINSQIPQMRVVPINASIKTDNLVMVHDEVRKLIQESPGPFAVADCVCKRGHDLDKTQCKKTDLRETCINIGTMGKMYLKNGAGREISRSDALKIISDAEKDGLVIQTMNAKDPEVICACCGCCCGVLSILKKLPPPWISHLLIIMPKLIPNLAPAAALVSVAVRWMQFNGRKGKKAR